MVTVKQNEGVMGGAPKPIQETKYPGIKTEIVEVPVGSLILTPLQSTNQVFDELRKWLIESKREFINY